MFARANAWNGAKKPSPNNYYHHHILHIYVDFMICKERARVTLHSSLLFANHVQNDKHYPQMCMVILLSAWAKARDRARNIDKNDVRQRWFLSILQFTYRSILLLRQSFVVLFCFFFFLTNRIGCIYHLIIICVCIFSFFLSFFISAFLFRCSPFRSPFF